MTKAIDFLRKIGLSINEKSGSAGFIPGIRITHGTIEVDVDACPVSNLLHEAAHLAITPTIYRHLLDGNISAGQRLMMDDLMERDLSPDDPLYRAAVQSSDPEATAWAWAAGLHLGIPHELIILDSEYDNDGADIRSCLQMNQYMGIHGLANAGFCVTKPRLVPYMKRPAYPELAFWLQEAGAA